MSSWFDHTLSSLPSSAIGRVLVDEPPSKSLWNTIRSTKGGISWLFMISDIPSFIDDLPDDLKPPTQRNPEGGLPKTVWVGGFHHHVWPDILDVRSRVRFLLINEKTDLLSLEEALDAWRCSNCGRRGTAPRPRACPHAVGLCGDARLLPEIHWVVDLTPGGQEEVAKMVHAAGAAYWPEEFPRVD